MQTVIHNVTLVLPDSLLEDGWLLVEDERIAAIGAGSDYPRHGVHLIDAASHLLLPGLIDLHCDAIEKLVEPRHGVFFPIAVALREADWRLAGCGITTEFHAVSLDDGEFGVRSDTFARDLYQAIQNETYTLIRHRIHTRLELSSQRGSKMMLQIIEQQQTDLVSVMDHRPGQGQFTTEQAFRDYVARTGKKTETEIEELIAHKYAQVNEIPERIERVTQLAHDRGLAIVTHDDDTPEKVEQWSRLGVSASEFPTTMSAALRARQLGLEVCVGAPNVLRGMSSSNNLSAMTAIQADAATILCSDYYPAAMLGAIFKLVDQRIMALPQAAALVTLNPARAIGWGSDYGSLEVGKLADIIEVEKETRNVMRVFVAGQERIQRH